ncbi:MAG: hypothetical protein ACTS8H_01105 [Arsenophonus sp. NC-PE1-MAG3]
MKLAFRNDFLLIRSGIRQSDVETYHQRRIMTSDQGPNVRIDYIVVSRPITHIADRV